MEQETATSEVKSRIWKLGLPMLGFIAISVAVYLSVDPRQFQHWLEGCDGVVIFLLIAILPLFGFPVSILQMLAGARFGVGVGFLVSTLSILVHMFGMYWIGTGFLRQPLELFLRRRKHRLPQVPKEE